MAGDSVGFKANANGLMVVFDKDETFDSIYEQISKKLESGGFFFQTRYLATTYKGRKLSSEEEGKISRMMSEKTGARTVLFEIDKDFERESKRSGTIIQNFVADRSNITNVDTPEASVDMRAADPPADTGSVSTSGASGFVRRRYAPMDLDECMTKYYRGTLRSGRLISYDGNVVIIGDINPGAEVEATGNIIVLGNVRGIVHAGAGGNKNASVVAVNFAPTQLRVADVITRRAERRGAANTGNAPEIAYLKGDSIVIEPLNTSR